MNIDKLVDRFLTWPLPKSVASDLCVTEPNYPHLRTGTSLLTADEAKMMIDYILRYSELTREQELAAQIRGHMDAMRPLLDEWQEIRSKSEVSK